MDSFLCHTQEWRRFRSDWFAYSGGGGNTGKGKLLLIAWSNWGRIWPSLLEQKLRQHLDTFLRWLYSMVEVQALMAIQPLVVLTLFMKWNRKQISKPTLRWPTRQALLCSDNHRLWPWSPQTESTVLMSGNPLVLTQYVPSPTCPSHYKFEFQMHTSERGPHPLIIHRLLS